MMTLPDLCAAMKESGRQVTPRTVREWWTRGLLPKPERKGLGRAKGTVTRWPARDVLAQAKAVHVILHPGRGKHRYDDAVVGLWLQGFRIAPSLVRKALLNRLGRHDAWIKGGGGNLDDRIGSLADRIARGVRSEWRAPEDVRHAIADVTSEFLGAFYGTEEEDTAHALADLGNLVMPYLQRPDVLAGVRELRVEDLEFLLPLLRDKASLPVQIKAVSAAADYDLVMAWRLIRLSLVIARRLMDVLGYASREDLGHLLCPLFRHFGPLAVPVLMAAMQEETIRRGLAAVILSGLRKSRDPAFLAEAARL